MMRCVLLALLLAAPATQAAASGIPGLPSISVEVRHPEGRPWAGLVVGLRSVSGLVESNITITDRSGKATFPVLCPGDDYEIHLHAEGYPPLAFEEISVKLGTFKFFLINPDAPFEERPAQLNRPAGSAKRRSAAHAEKPWVEWSGVRDPRTGVLHDAAVPERLACPDGTYTIWNLPDQETIRWLRRGFMMRSGDDPEENEPTFDADPLWVDERSQRSKDHSRPTSTSDWSGTRRLSAPL